jgi:SAM-dependent methyltransferase
MSFESYADNYEDVINRAIGSCGADHAAFTRGKALRLMALAAGIGDLRVLSVLDVGCGVGSTDVYLVPEFGQVHGVDISPAMVERAARRNPAAQYRVSEDPSRLPFEDASLDVVFASCVFHHVPLDARAALSLDIARVTRPGGIVAIFEHNPLNPLTRRVVSRCAFDADAVLLNRVESEQLLRAAGLSRVEGSYLFFSPWGGDRVRKLEERLGWLPLGAQYVVAGRR